MFYICLSRYIAPAMGCKNLIPLHVSAPKAPLEGASNPKAIVWVKNGRALPNHCLLLFFWEKDCQQTVYPS